MPTTEQQICVFIFSTFLDMIKCGSEPGSKSGRPTQVLNKQVRCAKNDGGRTKTFCPRPVRVRCVCLAVRGAE
jgi:hypothetical protein